MTSGRCGTVGHVRLVAPTGQPTSQSVVSTLTYPPPLTTTTPQPAVAPSSSNSALGCRRARPVMELKFPQHALPPLTVRVTRCTHFSRRRQVLASTGLSDRAAIVGASDDKSCKPMILAPGEVGEHTQRAAPPPGFSASDTIAIAERRLSMAPPSDERGRKEMRPAAQRETAGGTEAGSWLPIKSLVI
ncbi:hypothetical protein CDD83_3085 [Cordyceps sp. RAO-2017]|nr:hypothetical protein CDD83_3085 [Cordyceps sp. RAO-2017]